MAPADIGVLPHLVSLSRSASWDRAAAPYIEQLYLLPSKVFASITDPSALYDVYTTTNPLASAFGFSLAISVLFLVAAEVNRNWSQVDRFWSLLPSVYIIHFDVWAHLAGLPTSRLDLALALSLIWSARLTYNYWRKGGYEIGEEDYRWEILRDVVKNPFIWFVFDVVFIALIQNVLLFIVTAPVYILLLSARFIPDLTAVDYAFAALILGAISLAAVADQQQWDYHEAKEYYADNARAPPKSAYTTHELNRGFLATGLWGLSRHPNFVGEQSVWVLLYAWSCAVTGVSYHWAGAGALSYLALFQGSTRLTESISAGKYPDYATYQARVGMFFPWLPSLLKGVKGVGDEDTPPAMRTRSRRSIAHTPVKGELEASPVAESTGSVDVRRSPRNPPVNAGSTRTRRRAA